MPGRTHPVCVEYVDQAPTDVIADTVRQVMHLHGKRGDGDILCFLPGEDIIGAVQAKLAEASLADLDVLPLYSALAGEQQDLVFAPSPTGARKCVLSTTARALPPIS